MLRLIFIVICLGFIKSTAAAAPLEMQSAFKDTLIEPPKENPQKQVQPDTLTQPDSIPPPPPESADQDTSQNEGITPSEVPLYAHADLSPTSGNSGGGTITFTRVDNGVKITGEIKGLTPGLHGIHIHENGDCSDPAAENAGGHYNPDQKPHGAPEDIHRHTGDLGNIQADESGTAYIDITDTKISMSGLNSIIGKSIIIHAGRDDLKSQPAGNSGKRVLCGVINASDQASPEKSD